MNTYRQDHRTKEQFAQDIFNCTLIEKQLMIKYVEWLNKKGKGTYTFKDNGVDNSGQFIAKDSDVHLDSDFILIVEGKKDRKIEIKFSKKDNKTFHIKEAHLKFCIANDICIVNWMGVETNSPKFCILTPAFMKQYMEDNKPIMFYVWKKMCYKFLSKDMKWEVI